MSKNISLILKNSLYLFARVILVCVLAFMAIPLASVSRNIFNPIFAVFYFIVLFYFFVLTTWHEGVRDRNRVEIGLIKENKAKGFISAGIVLLFLLLVNYLPMFFSPDSRGVFVTILSVVKVIFASAVSYATSVFIGDVDLSNMGGNAEHLMISSTVFTVIYTVCAVSSGISYIIGYKNIVLFGDKIEKIKSMFKS